MDIRKIMACPGSYLINQITRNGLLSPALSSRGGEGEKLPIGVMKWLLKHRHGRNANRMETTGRTWPLRSVIAGVVYFAAGMVFGALAGAASSNEARVGWRLAAWGLSGAVFLG